MNDYLIRRAYQFSISISKSRDSVNIESLLASLIFHPFFFTSEPKFELAETAISDKIETVLDKNEVVVALAEVKPMIDTPIVSNNLVTLETSAEKPSTADTTPIQTTSNIVKAVSARIQNMLSSSIVVEKEKAHPVSKQASIAVVNSSNKITKTPITKKPMIVAPETKSMKYLFFNISS